MARVNSHLAQVSEAEILQIPDHQVAISPLAEVNGSPLETVSKAIHSSRSTNVQENIFVQENMSTNAAHGIISGGSFSNCSFNFQVNFERGFRMFFFSVQTFNLGFP